MAEPPGNDRLYCWEQVARVNPLFRISHAFAPNALSPRLLPLYALFAALEQLCSQTIDAELKRRKLAWWRSECLDRGPVASDHPVLKELTRSGAAAHLDQAGLAQLFGSVEQRLDTPAPADEAEFESLCRKTGEPLCALEFAVTANGRETAVPATAACLGLAQLLRESTGQGGEHRFWWLPLNLVARHGVSRSDLARDRDAPLAQALFAEVLRPAHSWAPKSAQEIQRAADESASLRHLAVHAHLQAQAVQRLRSMRPGNYRVALRRAGWLELFQAWRAARRVTRR